MSSLLSSKLFPRLKIKQIRTIFCSIVVKNEFKGLDGSIPCLNQK